MKPAERNCTATGSRMALTRRLHEALDIPFRPEHADGSEEHLLQTFRILQGIAAEYTDGGDQMADLCDCGSPNHREGHAGQSFEAILRGAAR